MVAGGEGLEKGVAGSRRRQDSSVRGPKGRGGRGKRKRGRGGKVDRGGIGSVMSRPGEGGWGRGKNLKWKGVGDFVTNGI
jgi:hypothetical protein